MTQPGSSAARFARWSTRVARRFPFALTLLIVILALGVVLGALSRPAARSDWFHYVAVGIPSLEQGHWWTVLTAPFVLGAPAAYIIVLLPALAAVGWDEWRFGSRRTIAVFFGGQVVAALGALAIVWALQPTGWSWALRAVTRLASGPLPGALAVLVFAIAALPAPWRLRARIILISLVTLLFLYGGRLVDLQNLVVVVVASIVAGTVTTFRHPRGRPSEREWRLIGFAWLIALGVIDLIDLSVPYDGPLGNHSPGAVSLFDVLLDLVIIVLFANGIRRGYRVAWIGVQILGWVNVALGVVWIALFALLAFALDLNELLDGALGSSTVSTVLWMALLVFLIVGRGAFRVPIRRSRRIPKTETITPKETARRLRQIGGGTISWMATWPANRQIAAGEGAIAYQAHSGVAIMLGDPIVPVGEASAAFDRFVSDVGKVGLIPCVFTASEAAAQARPQGWRALVVALDTIVDLPELEFRGRAWNSVRTSINKAEREGIGFRLVRLSEQPYKILAQVRTISEQWAGDKGLPEMRFTLGTVQEALDPEVLVGIAIDADGNVHGVVSWLPVYACGGRIRGWTLDLMRRREDGFSAVMEYLIASCARQFSQEGYEFISLSGAPLVRPEDGDDGPIDQVLDQVAGMIEPLYGFASLHRFKQKFSPRSESLYLLYRDEGDLPRIGLALTNAYLPDATLRDLLRSARRPADTGAVTGRG